jgi:hypothetical protein
MTVLGDEPTRAWPHHPGGRDGPGNTAQTPLPNLIPPGHQSLNTTRAITSRHNHRPALASTQAPPRCTMQHDTTRPKAGGFLAGGFHQWQRRTARPAEPDQQKTKTKNQNSVRSAAHRLPQCDNWGRLGSEQPSSLHVPSCGRPYSILMWRRSISIWNDKACHCEQQPILPLCDENPISGALDQCGAKSQFLPRGLWTVSQHVDRDRRWQHRLPHDRELLTRQCGKDRSKRKHSNGVMFRVVL